MSDHIINDSNPLYLIVARDNEEPTTINLEEGNSLFIGSGSNCKVTLEGDKVQPIHCMVWMEDHVLRIQDWNTGATVLNGQLVDPEAKLNSGDRVTIGDYQIIPVLDQDFHRGIAVELLNGQNVGAADSSHSNPEHGQLTSEQETQEPLELIRRVDNDANDDLSLAEAEQLIADIKSNNFSSPSPAATENTAENFESENTEPVKVESVKKAPKFTYNIDADLEDDSATSVSSAYAADPFAASGFSSGSNEKDAQDNEDVELLQMEVEQLRFELAERDVQLQSLRDAASNSSNDDNQVDDTQTLKLVDRLEDLLDELQVSDERVKGLEELLRLSDQATQAEKEERSQLEVWVTEIENRVAQREAESQAEIGRANKRLEEAQAHVDRVDAQFQTLLQAQQNIETGSTPSEEAQSLINECRVQIEDLRTQVVSLTDENEKLRTRPMVSDDELAASEQLRDVQGKLAKLEVEVSCERAEMARKHAELERMRDELEEKLRSAQNIGKSDSRIQAMRQHLREIHEEEKLEREERKQRSLGGRIASLLMRTR